jgi:hypothetical protein
LMADMTGLKPLRVGNVLFVTTKENAIEMRDDPERTHVIGPCPLPSQIGSGQIGGQPLP